MAFRFALVDEITDEHLHINQPRYKGAPTYRHYKYHGILLSRDLFAGVCQLGIADRYKFKARRWCPGTGNLRAGHMSAE